MVIISIIVVATTTTTQIVVYHDDSYGMNCDGDWVAVLITSGSCKCLNRVIGWDQFLL